MFKRLLWTLTLTILLASTLASAALYVSTDETLLYDSVLDITWVLDGNYAVTSDWVNTAVRPRRLDKKGHLTWRQAEEFVGTLTLELSSAWRQGTLTELETLYNTHLNSNVNASTVTLYDGTTIRVPNVQDFGYWTSDNAGGRNYWSLSFVTGESSALPRNSARVVWPVHDGDVGFVASATWQGTPTTWQGESVTW